MGLKLFQSIFLFDAVFILQRQIFCKYSASISLLYFAWMYLWWCHVKSCFGCLSVLNAKWVLSEFIIRFWGIMNFKHGFKTCCSGSVECLHWKITHQSSMLCPRLASTLLWKAVRSKHSSQLWGKFVAEPYFFLWLFIDVFWSSDRG